MVTTVEAPDTGEAWLSSVGVVPPSVRGQPHVPLAGHVPPTLGKQLAIPLSEAAAATPAAPVRISRRVILGLPAMGFVSLSGEKYEDLDEE
jgi:hypothetical protein